VTQRAQALPAPVECGMRGLVFSASKAVLGVLVSTLLLAGCGRPATLDECNEIVSRITELELRSRGSAGQSAEMVKDTVEALKKTTLKDCVGRRIDDQAMSCVRNAQTTQQIVKECF
jgi:hypothetical protein